MPTDLGTTAIVTWTRKPIDGGHAVTLVVTRPDGTTLDPSPIVTYTGNSYAAQLVCDQPGRYALRWLDGTDDSHATDTLEVWPADPRFLISFDDAVHSLQWREPDVQKNGEMLRLYIAAATEVIEDICGAVLVRNITQHADGGRTGVLLWDRPDGAVAVTVSGKPYSGARVNLNAGIVYAAERDGWFPDGRQNVVISYQAGSTQVSPSIQLATRELVRHLWQIGQQSNVAGEPVFDGNGQQIGGMTRTGFAVPKRVIELCGNQHALPGMA